VSQVAVVDPDYDGVESAVFHLHAVDFVPEDSISDSFVYFSSTIFQEVLPGFNTESIIARGLKSVRFFGIEIHSRQQRKVEVRTFDLLWKVICDGFNPLIDVTFFLHPTSALFNMFLTPVDRKIAFQAQESNQRGNFLPLSYSEWSDLSMVATSKHPYVEKQWNSTMELLFNSKDVKYKIEIIKNPDHAVYKFISLFSLLLKKLNFRWSKIIKIENELKSCCILGDFFADTKCPYSGDDDENDLSQKG
jgi:hypothetical protein